MTVSVVWPQIVFAACVGTFTIAAAVWDVRERRIPNWLNLAALTGAVFWQMATYGWTGLGDAAAGFSAGFSPFFAAWLLGGNGAGDAKMLGALGAWFGLTATLLVMVTSIFLLLCIQIIGWGYSHVAKPVPAGSTPPRSPNHQKTPFAVPVLGAAWGIGLLKLMQIGIS